MPEHKIGTPEDWQAALKQLANLEAEHAQLSQKVTEERRQLPCARLSPVLQAHELAEGGADLIDYYRAYRPGAAQSGQCHGRQWGDRRGRDLALLRRGRPGGLTPTHAHDRCVVRGERERRAPLRA
jgi:Bacterial protein of unknown function (DUF899)